MFVLDVLTVIAAIAIIILIISNVLKTEMGRILFFSTIAVILMAIILSRAYIIIMEWIK